MVHERSYEGVCGRFGHHTILIGNETGPHRYRPGPVGMSQPPARRRGGCQLKFFWCALMAATYAFVSLYMPYLLTEYWPW